MKLPLDFKVQVSMKSSKKLWKPVPIMISPTKQFNS